MLFFAACLPDIAHAFNIVKVRSHAGSPPVEAVDRMVLVKFKASVVSAQKAAVHSSIGASVKGELPDIGWVSVELPPGMSVETGLAIYRQKPDVLEAVPNTVYRPSTVPNDTLLTSQYGLSAIDAFRGWNYETGATNKVTIGIIDTGIDGKHSDLSDKISDASSFFNPVTGARSAEPVPTDCLGHGTGVAGIAAATGNNALGIAGVSWGAELLSLRVFDDVDGCDETDTPAIAAAIAYAVDLATTPAAGTGPMVLNLSLGGNDSTCNPVLVSAVNLALSNNVVVVAAAGNDRVVECPAKIPGVIAVGATDALNNVASFSALGSSLTVTAPGVGIVTTKNNDGYEYSATGTSFASPHVAGLAALLRSAVPLKTNSEIVAIIRNSADDLGPEGFDTSYGWGKIDILSALSFGITGKIAKFQVDLEQKARAYPNPFNVSVNRLLF
ncbi:MAG: S8 family serine peptidase, partial [bacterium]